MNKIEEAFRAGFFLGDDDGMKDGTFSKISSVDMAWSVWSRKHLGKKNFSDESVIEDVKDEGDVSEKGIDVF